MNRLALLCALLALPLLACGPTIGDACTTAAECGAGTCLNVDYAPGGACSIACTLDGTTACPLGSTCVKDALGRGAPGCLRGCTQGSDCRAGYVCEVQKSSATPVCVGPTGI